MLMEDRWADVVEKEIRERLAGLLYKLGETHGVVTNDGPTIGSNREAVTRAFAELQEAGCVEVRSRQVYIKDCDALKRHAGE